MNLDENNDKPKPLDASLFFPKPLDASLLLANNASHYQDLLRHH